MTPIITDCPFFEEITHVATPSGSVIVRPYQIVLWVSVAIGDRLSRRLPVILDTGHTHNFSIGQEHLAAWGDIRPAAMHVIGQARINKQPVQLMEARISVCRNVPGKRDSLDDDVPPFVLEMSEGIAVHYPKDPSAPRLPLLGLRALVRNRLALFIDGQRRLVTLVGP